MSINRSKNKKNSQLKLHLGCGDKVKPGYINIDQFTSADGIQKLSIFNLPFEPDSVDEIFTEHMLEHLSKFEIPVVLKEWARALKPEGKLIMNLPNLEWCMQQWLSKSEQERWDWQLDTIFGLQTHPGEFHKTGFSAPRLHQLLMDAGFSEITIEECLSHGQNCFWVEASKGNQQNTSKYFASIIVPWWDHGELLELWENNITHLSGYEIIFIDNGSQKSTQLALQNFCKKYSVKLIRNEENRGFSAANNQGIEAASGEYLLFLNDDVEILKPLVPYLCYLAGNGISGPGPVRTEMGEVYIEGWALCIKKSRLQSIGGWCEDYGPGYWDDVDLCCRAKLMSYPMRPIPDIGNWIRHIGNTTGRDGRLDQLALHFQNRQKFIKKYYSKQPKIIIDGVFFQLYKTGIARVWKSILEEWANQDFAKHIVVLDRAGTAPKIPHIRYRLVPAYNYSDTELDRQMLQQVCDEEGADLFISTYYTTPISTPSVFMAYDMIPELLGANLQEPMWREKQLAIQHASAYIAISENTAYDLCNLYSDVSSDAVTVAQCGVQATFSPSSTAEIDGFKLKYGISKPYFLLVGGGAGYKNSLLFFQAFSRLPSKQGFDIVCTGSNSLLETDFREYTAGVTVHMLRLDDDELKIAYSGAIALAYPSLYEGFGLPIVEAMASGCPVITCPNASIPEVAGDAALYVDDSDPNALANALCEVQKPEIRQSLVEMGFAQAAKFSWTAMANEVSSALIKATLASLNLREFNFIAFPDWSQPEETYCTELADVIRAIATHPDKSQITLLINSDSIPSEDANLILSSITMNLLLEEELEVSDGPEISLLPHLSNLQWQTLLTRIAGRITLPHENQEAIAAVGANNLAISNLETLQHS